MSGQAAARYGIPWLLRSRTRLGWVMGLAVLLPMVIAGALILRQAWTTLRAQAERQLATANQLAAQVVDEHLQGLSNELRAVAGRRSFVRAVVGRERAVVDEELAHLVDASRSFDRAHVNDAAGISLYNYPFVADVVGKSFAHREWYQGAVRKGDLHISNVFVRAGGPRVRTVAVVVPIRDDAGAIAGYVVGQNTVDGMSERLANVRPSSTGSITLIDAGGQLATRQGSSSAALVDLSRNELVQRALASSRLLIEGDDPLSGERSLLAFQRSPVHGWLVMAREPLSAVYADARVLQVVSVALIALCVCLVFGCSFWISDLLRRKYRLVADLEASKTRLTDLLVHDLRNPLTAAITTIETAREDLPPQLTTAQADLDHAAASCRRMLDMVNVMMDVARMDAGKMPLERRSQDLNALVSTTVSEYAAVARDRHLRLVRRGSQDAVEASVDGDLMARVLDNLITNAVKHTPAGGEISIEVGKASHGRAAQLVVRDNGEGIAPQYLPRLFEKYGRIERQTMSTKYDIGLGLVFCRMAVELHGGRIDVASQVGEGTAFTIELPV